MLNCDQWTTEMVYCTDEFRGILQKIWSALDQKPVARAVQCSELSNASTGVCGQGWMALWTFYITDIPCHFSDRNLASICLSLITVQHLSRFSCSLLLTYWC